MKIKFKKPHVPYGWQKFCIDNMRDYNSVVAARQHGKTELFTEVGYSVIHSPHIKNPTWVIASDEIGRCYDIYSNRLNDHFSNNHYFKWTSPKTSEFQIPRKYGDNISIFIEGSKHNPSGPKGKSVHYFLTDECGKTVDRYFEESVAPTVAQTGGVCVNTGTVEANHWQDLFYKARQKMEEGNPFWYAFYMKWGDKWSRQAFNPNQLERMRAAYNLLDPKDLRTWRKEYLCDWDAAGLGRPFSRSFDKMFQQKRVGKYEFNNKFAVGTAWDNGHTTAIWFWQLVGGRVVMIDYKEYIEMSTAEICQDVNKWYSERGAYTDRHIFPHTMAERVQEAGMSSKMEIAARYLRADINRDVILIKRVKNIDDKIDMTRALLDRCYFNQDTCNMGLRAIQQYKRKVSTKTGVVSKDIVKDQYSHGAEAIGELAIAVATGKLGMLNSYVGEKELQGDIYKNSFFQQIEKEEEEERMRRFRTNEKLFDITGGY